jgi:hypothetical protein
MNHGPCDQVYSMQHICDKLSVSTSVGASLLALQHGHIDNPIDV